jgi:hypothetical protein
VDPFTHIFIKTIGIKMDLNGKKIAFTYDLQTMQSILKEKLKAIVQ